MRPCYLEFCGINSFSEPTKIDFSDLLQYGIFGIFGDTGSGKSTILDCISFALYGGTPRVRSGNSDLINYRSERAYVYFEFEISFEGERKRFRVERELKRKGTPHVARVIDCGSGVVRAEGIREVKTAVEQIVGLEQQDFEKCIALPQGEFAQFVKEQRSERLKIVSRLFDLEEYGEALVARAAARHREAQAAWEISKTRLEPYEGVTEEGNKALEVEVSALSEKERTAKEALAAGRKRESALAEEWKLLKEKQRTEARLKVLEGEKEEIETLEGALSRMPSAAETSRFAEELSRAERDRKEAETLLKTCEERKLRAAEKEREIAAWDEEKADEEIAALTERKARAEQAEKEASKRAALEKQLLTARRAYAAEAENFKDFSYEEERKKAEETLASMGSGDLLSYLREHAKEGLLAEEYHTFAGELKAIEQKYPETEEDIRPLIEKYSRAGGEKVEFSALKADFEEREKRRHAAQTALVDLEKRNALYTVHREKLQQLQTEGLRLREELDALGKEEGEKKELVERALLEKKREKRERAEERKRFERELLEANTAAAAAGEKLRAANGSVSEAEKRLEGALKRGDFKSAEEAKALLARFGDPAAARQRVTGYREEYSALTARLKEFGNFTVTEEALVSAREEVSSLEQASEETSRAAALKRAELSRGQKALEKKKELEGEEKAKRREAEIAERLKKIFEGNKFMEFIAEEYLQSVAGRASARLLTLTGGRYFLRYDKGFLVGDNLNGGKMRGVNTLSGGELFLVSLSLALALSSEICAKSSRPIEFFFLDEGFGTLDERLVDTVMDSLEKLRGEHFAIGIISHVEELKHRVEKKLFVEKATDSHGSQIHA